MTNEEVDQVLFSAEHTLRQAMGGGMSPAAPSGQLEQFIAMEVERRLAEKLSMIPQIPGPKGEDGKDGSSVSVEDVKPIVNEAIAQIPKPEVRVPKAVTVKVITKDGVRTAIVTPEAE